MKSRLTAALLAILLGGIGIHRLYLGKWITGLLYMLFCWTYIPAVLGLLEGIYLALMPDHRFNDRYNPGTDTPHPDTHVKCPDCAELVKREAKVCKHCGCRLIPQ